MVASAALRERDSSITSPLSPDELANLLATDATEANEAVAQWLEHFNPSAEQVIAALGPAVEEGKVNERLRKALGSLADDWNDDQKADLLDAQAPAFVRGETSDLLLGELRVGGADPDRAAATLARLFNEARNNDERDASFAFGESPSRQARKPNGCLWTRCSSPSSPAAKVE